MGEGGRERRVGGTKNREGRREMVIDDCIIH